MTLERSPEADPSRATEQEPVVIGQMLPAVPASIAAVRGAIVRLALSRGAEPGDLDRIALAVSEAVTNAVRHAYPPGTAGPVRYLADIEGDDLQVIVADAGHGLDSEHRSPGLGIGLQLIAHSTSDFALTTLDGGGFEVWMRFILAGPPAARA
jgi:serine/threonine-protein kinase RsbW